VCGCVYRFTNKHIFVPDGAKKIAIAPIFDSSRIVIPHDMIWHSLQQAFASSGHLIVETASKADFFLQAHVKDAASSQYESDALATLQNPDQFINPATNQPYAPSDYVNLHAADNFSKRERLSFNVLVEIWDLRNRTLLLKKEYPVASNFNMFAIPSTRESQFLRNEENNELLVNSLSKDFAQNVVNDLFSSPSFARKTP
jgi:hypothetical protein